MGQGASADKPAEIDPFEDPLFPGESMKDDAEVTLLVAVVLAPKKDNAKSEQQQVAGAGN